MLNGIHGHQDIERVVYGKPAGAAVLGEAERLGARRVFITTTKSVAQSALLAGIIRDLGERYAGVYAGITAHSPRPCVIEGAQLARAAKADLIVSVGGGSAIDATKVMLIALWQNATTVDDLDLYKAGKPKGGAAPPSEAIAPPADAIRMIAVPTTLSAAEFNAFAGISDPRRGVKESFGHRLVVPRVIVLDPAATLHTPMDLMLSTGLKAVDHAVERLCSQQANPFAIGTSTEALKLLATALPAHKARPDDLETRMNLQFGMWLSIGAGTSGVGVGASHGIGHVLGAACHVPHGHTSCVMLPSVLRWNLPANADRQTRVSEAFGKPDTPAADLVAELVKTLELPGSLKEVGVGRERFREIGEKSMHDRAVLNNPRTITSPEQVMEILELAARHGLMSSSHDSTLLEGSKQRYDL